MLQKIQALTCSVWQEFEYTGCHIKRENWISGDSILPFPYFNDSHFLINGVYSYSIDGYHQHSYRKNLW